MLLVHCTVYNYRDVTRGGRVLTVSMATSLVIFGITALQVSTQGCIASNVYLPLCVGEPRWTQRGPPQSMHQMETQTLIGWQFCHVLACKRVRCHTSLQTAVSLADTAPSNTTYGVFAHANWDALVPTHAMTGCDTDARTHARTCTEVPCSACGSHVQKTRACVLAVFERRPPQMWGQLPILHLAPIASSSECMHARAGACFACRVRRTLWMPLRIAAGKP